jgi:hypothetical protein
MCNYWISAAVVSSREVWTGVDHASSRGQWLNYNNRPEESRGSHGLPENPAPYFSIDHRADPTGAGPALRLEEYFHETRN